MNENARLVRPYPCAVLVASLLISASPSPGSPAPEQAGAAAAVSMNRSGSHLKAQRATLAFSAQPTTEEEISRARVFVDPLEPVGGEPSPSDNAALADALRGYAQRRGPDDFSSLTAFLQAHPRSPWAASVLTGLGTEYYNTAHYSLALDAWRQAWAHANEVQNAKGKAVIDRAVSELAYLYARLGRMTELEPLLQSVENRQFLGGPRQKIIGAREALWMMQHRPEVSFRCGPLALQSIRRALDPHAPLDPAIFHSASTQQGFSLAEVAALSRKVGLNYQMAFREPGGAFVVPSVVHWKVGHYAAIVRQAGDRYLVEDPTFRNTVWPTRQALAAETSGYFLIPPGKLPPGWRSVGAQEGGRVWGKGVTSDNDSDVQTCMDIQTLTCTDGHCHGMPVSSVHLMVVNLQVRDSPLGYVPPVGPPIWFTVRYNHRGLGRNVLGANWTHDWISWIMDDPSNLLADVTYYPGGGGARTFTGFDTNTQTFAYQQYDQTLLRRTGPDSYEMTSPDGSKKIFAQSDGSVGTTRAVYLTQLQDPAGNAVTLSYDANLRLTGITDALGQTTTLSYGTIDNGCSDPAKHNVYTVLDQVTDPFGRSASFQYAVEDACSADEFVALTGVTDVIGMQSQFTYTGSGLPPQAIMTSMTTPYGTTTFSVDDGTQPTYRFVETHYPDGSRERVEFNQAKNLGIPNSDPTASVPVGMSTYNIYLYGRNTFYWSREACALAYGDYTKARIYHWLHEPNLTTTSGILESTKQPLENRVWYNYAGQAGAYVVGDNNRPTRVGRVLDDYSTQLYTYAYNGFGHVTNAIGPLGRTLSFLYDTNGTDLLEIRQTRSGNELLFKATYNAQHRPLTQTDAAGQTTTYTYNARGQVLTATNPKGETITYTYDPKGYLIAVDGPLAGTNDTVGFTYDEYGRTHTMTDVSGYTLTFDYDALDRLTRITYPDATYVQYTYDRLDLSQIRDRAGRITGLEHNSMRQLVKRTDPLGRVTLFDWCRCGALKSLIDPMGRATSWLRDVQGRLVGKQYDDGSRVQYLYGNAKSRLLQVIDEKRQSTLFTYNHDDTLNSISYLSAGSPTPGVSYTYDPNYERVTSMTDGTGTTLYQYYPITTPPSLGAGRLASVDGPLTNDTITYVYDELGRRTSTAINGVATTRTFDAAWRVVGESNALGSFGYGYDGPSSRLVSESFPNGQTAALAYGSVLQDLELQRITFQASGTPVSEFLYTRDLPRGEITSWSQQVESQPALVSTLGYDDANQLLSATVTQNGTPVNSFGYTYDPAGNRLTEQNGAAVYTATYNALNQLSTSTEPGSNLTNEWDAAGRLAAVNEGNQRTEFTYDGLSRLVGIRQLVNGAEVSHRLFVWDGGRLAEERDTNGVVTKQFFPQGVRVVSGPNAGPFYYTRDHLGSIRELTDATGAVRARYAYDPFGGRTKVSGDMDADFGFAGMFWSAEANLSLTHFRAYDPVLGRWLSRDPLGHAEWTQGPNLYAYLGNDPVDLTDPLGEGPPLYKGYAPYKPVPPPGPVPPPPPQPAPPPPEPDPFDPDYWFESPAPAGEIASDPVYTAPAAGVATGTAVAAPGFFSQNICAGSLVGLPGVAVAAAGGAGYGFGWALNHRFDISGFASDQGVKVQKATGSRILGAIVTLDFATDASSWLVEGVIRLFR
jgi:RHS repeat-associated protein